tara:strand:- start:85 stop:438 length:354 start_codon:yes stop_codon:yes gene_type:complete
MKTGLGLGQIPPFSLEKIFGGRGHGPKSSNDKDLRFGSFLFIPLISSLPSDTMDTMSDTKKAGKIIEAVRTLNEFDRVVFLHALMGLVQVDSPRSIIDAAKWSTSAEKIKEALDNIN